MYLDIKMNAHRNITEILILHPYKVVLIFSSQEIVVIHG